MKVVTYIDGAGRLRCAKCGAEIPGLPCDCTKPLLEELRETANRLARLHWGVDYTGEIELVKRMWHSQRAAYHYKLKDKSFQVIRMSEPLIKTLKRSEWVGDLLHELVHWRLHQLDKPFLDTDKEFVQECFRVGAPLSGTKSAQAAAEKYLANQTG